MSVEADEIVGRVTIVGELVEGYLSTRVGRYRDRSRRGPHILETTSIFGSRRNDSRWSAPTNFEMCLERVMPFEYGRTTVS